MKTTHTSCNQTCDENNNPQFLNDEWKFLAIHVRSFDCLAKIVATVLVRLIFSLCLPVAIFGVHLIPPSVADIGYYCISNTLADSLLCHTWLTHRTLFFAIIFQISISIIINKIPSINSVSIII